MPQYYTYVLRDSGNNEPFYVGKGSGSRMYQHLREARRDDYVKRSLHYKILSILKRGSEVVYERVEWPSEHEAFEEEKRLIKELGRKDLSLGPLCNLTDGGEGGQRSRDSVERTAAKHRGMKRSPEARERMRQAQLQIVEERVATTGYKRSPESRKKQSQATRGKPWTPTARAVVRDKPTAIPVVAFDKATGVRVGEWESMARCAKDLNCDVTAVWKILSGFMSRAPDGSMRPYRSHKGYTFKYKEGSD